MKNKISISEAAKYLDVSIDTLRRWDQKDKLRAERSKGGHRYYSQPNLELYKQDIFALARNWILDTPKEPEKKFYCPTSTEFKGRLSKLQNDLEKIEGLKEYYPLIVAIVGEIGNNSFDHNLGNWPDISGIFFAYDTNKKQIVLADRGRGVLRTLRTVKPSIKGHKEALLTAFTEIISARAPEARGNGLKFVREVVLNNPVQLLFYSGNAKVSITDKVKDLKIENIEEYYSGCLAAITF